MGFFAQNISQNEYYPKNLHFRLYEAISYLLMENENCIASQKSYNAKDMPENWSRNFKAEHSNL